MGGMASAVTVALNRCKKFSDLTFPDLKKKYHERFHGLLPKTKGQEILTLLTHHLYVMFNVI